MAAEAAAAAAARLLDGIKISNETAAIALTEAVQTGLGVNDSGNSSGRRRLLGVTIAAKRRRRDDRNGGSDGVGASLVSLKRQMSATIGTKRHQLFVV